MTSTGMQCLVRMIFEERLSCLLSFLVFTVLFSYMTLQMLKHSIGHYGSTSVPLQTTQHPLTSSSHSGDTSLHQSHHLHHSTIVDPTRFIEGPPPHHTPQYHQQQQQLQQQQQQQQLQQQQQQQYQHQHQHSHSKSNFKKCL
jgi:hypothetical protein